MAELVAKFGVSVETIRRDLAFLEERRKLIRVHGGAVAITDKMKELSKLSERVNENVQQKRELSMRAADLIKERDVIALDSGSTANEFIRILCDKFEKLTIVTYSRDVFEIASNKPDFTVIMIGGNYYAPERVFCGFLAEELINRLHVSKAFIFPASISIKYGITITVSEIYNLERALMSISDHTYILCDSSKFECASPIRLCNFVEIDAIVTDKQIDENILKLYREKGIEIIT